MQDETAREVVEETAPEVADATVEGIEETPTPKMTKGGMLKAIRGALASGGISKSQAANMRSEMGIDQSSFTKKPFNRAKARAADKRAKAARKATRNSHKGQKMGGK